MLPWLVVAEEVHTHWDLEQLHTLFVFLTLVRAERRRIEGSSLWGGRSKERASFSPRTRQREVGEATENGDAQDEKARSGIPLENVSRSGTYVKLVNQRRALQCNSKVYLMCTAYYGNRAVYRSLLP